MDVDGDRGPYEAAMSGRQVVRAVTGLTMLSFLSPVTGLLIEGVLAWRFGASATVDGFRIGMLLVILVQQLLVVSVLPNLIVPLLVRSEQGSARTGWQVVVRLGWVLSVPTAAVTLLLYTMPGPIVTLLAPGFEGAGRETAIFFVRYLSLAFLPILWTGLWVGVLHARRIFWITPVAQMAGNLVFAAILALGRDGHPAVPAVAALVGVCVPLPLSWLAVRRYRQAGGGSTAPVLGRADVRRLAGLAAPLLAGALVAQVGGIIVNRQLSMGAVGSVAAFGYAWKLLQIVAIPSAAIATVLFPLMAVDASRAARRDGGSGTPVMASAGGGDVTRALRMTVFLLVPLTCLLVLVREPLVALLLGRGEFSAEAVALTSRFFGLLVLGAPAVTLTLLLSKACYAGQDTRSPALVQAVGVGVLALAAPVCTARAGAPGLALLLSVIAWLVCLGLVVNPVARVHMPPLATLGRALLGTSAITAASVLAWWATMSLDLVRATVGGIPSTALAIGVGALVFAILTHRSGLSELVDLRSSLRWYGMTMLRRDGGAGLRERP